MNGDDASSLRRSLAERVPHDGGPDWTMTFADTMSLLMGFFVLLLSFSSLDRVRFVDVSGHVQETFGSPAPSPASAAPPSVSPGAAGDRPLPRPAREAAAGLGSVVAAWRRQTTGDIPVRVFESYRGVEVSLPADRVFEPGLDRLTDSASGLVAVLAGQLDEAGRARTMVIEVPGDTLPRMPAYEDAWALAMGRAQALERAVRGTWHGPAQRVVPSALGAAARGAPQVTFLFEGEQGGGRGR